MPAYRARVRIAVALFIAQSFYAASSIAAFTLTPIIAAELAGSASAAGVPNTIGIVGRALFALPLGIMMERFGRRRALATGYTLSIVGALLSMWAVVTANFPLFLAGALLLGMSRSASDQSRYVAAELFRSARRARVIGLLIFAGTVGSVLGPQIVPLSANWAIAREWPQGAGPFAAAALAMVLATLTLILFLRPDPRELALLVAQAERAEDPQPAVVGPKRPLSLIFADPLIRLALLSMIFGYFVMSFLMIITPLHMDQSGHDTAAISTVIMLHTLGMFGLSWLTGSLIDRFGRIQIIVVGGLLLLLSCIIAPLSTEVAVLGLALFLLGLGWNLCFVGGSSLFSDTLQVHERARAQGAGETLVAIGLGISSLTVGVAFSIGSYLLVSTIGAMLTVVLLLAVWALQRRSRPPLQLAASAD